MSPSFDPKDLLDVPDPFASQARADLRVPDIEALPPAPTRSRTRALRVGAVVAAIACETALIAAKGLRSGPSLSATVIGVALPLVIAAVALATAQAPSSRRRSVLVAIVASAVVFVVTTILTRAHGDESARGIIGCVIGTSMMVAGPALFAIFSMRHTFVTGATVRTAALGIASGLVGAAATRLYCPNDALSHVLIGHGTPILLATLVAAAIGPRFTRA